MMDNGAPLESTGNDVRPFKAIHYNPDRVEEIGQCLSQPYDVINPEQQSAYYEQHELNVVRLILNRERPEDNQRSNRYTRASNYLRDWVKKGILKTSRAPSFWIYDQDYETSPGSRSSIRGFIGIVRLRDFEEGCVIPHEKVMKGPIEDRMRLAKSTETQFESIWGFYQDPSTNIDSVLETVCRSGPSLDYLEKPFDDSGSPVRHRLWNCQDTELCRTIKQRMKQLKIYIADGHHRYHTMLTLRDEKRKQKKTSDAGPWEYILMWLVNASSNVITIRPYHRMIHSVDPARPQTLMSYLERYFTIKSFPDLNVNGDSRVRDEWLRELRASGEKTHTFGVMLSGENGLFTVALKNDEAYLREVDSQQAPSPSDAWKLLDVNILNSLVLRNGLGITEKRLSDQTNVTYTHRASEAIERVGNGEMQMAFFLNPTKLEEVITLSQNDEVLPRKSTFFYPKAVSGLAFYSMGDTPL